jgi:DNA mismatch repair ATPase MutL
LGSLRSDSRSNSPLRKSPQRTRPSTLSDQSSPPPQKSPQRARPSTLTEQPAKNSVTIVTPTKENEKLKEKEKEKEEKETKETKDTKDKENEKEKSEEKDTKETKETEIVMEASMLSKNTGLVLGRRRGRKIKRITQRAARVRYNYTAQEPNELTIKAGEIVLVYMMDVSGWYEGELNGKRGLFPGNYVDFCDNDSKRYKVYSFIFC